MAKMTIENLDHLIYKIEKLGMAGNQVARRSLKKAAKPIVMQQKQDGPRHKGGPANGKSKHGADALKVGPIRTSKSKNKYVQIGIVDSAVWEYAKGVYFQHHGFYNWVSNRYIAGSQWMDKSFEKAKSQSAKILIDALERELKF